MKDLLVDVFLAATLCGAIVAAIFAAVLALTWANEKWNCSSYESAPTKMMAATCYVQDKNGKWVTHSSYVKAVNVNVGVEP